MNTKNFRYLFENADDGIILSGSILDKESEEATNFAYACGMRNNKIEDIEEHPVTEYRFEKTEERCHLLVLASFSVRYIKSLLRLLKEKRLETVLLPYVVPIQRLNLLQWYKEEAELDPDFREFVEHPYSYLKHAGVENVYLVYGNGEIWSGEMQQRIPGHHFELVDNRELQIIKKMEGRYVPVVKAGYIIENDWLFYFGHFGREINLQEQPGDIIASTIVMFQSPLHTEGNRIDSVMNGKVFKRGMDCVPYISKQEKNCMLRCIYEEDHAVYRKHKKKTSQQGCFGTFAIGNVNIGRYMPELNMRFRGIMKQVRAITIPGCGNLEYWNRHCLTLLFGENVRYWICGLDHTTSPNVIADVVVASPQNRIVTISEEFGYCFSGYLIPYVEKDE